MFVKDLDKKLDEYCDELLVLKNLSPITIKNYCTTNKAFIKYLNENDIIELTTVDGILKKYIIYLRKENNNTYSTINKYLQEIISFLKQLSIKINIDLPKIIVKIKR